MKKSVGNDRLSTGAGGGGEGGRRPAGGGNTYRRRGVGEGGRNRCNPRPAPAPEPVGVVGGGVGQGSDHARTGALRCVKIVEINSANLAGGRKSHMVFEKSTEERTRGVREGAWPVGRRRRGRRVSERKRGTAGRAETTGGNTGAGLAFLRPSDRCHSTSHSPPLKNIIIHAAFFDILCLGTLIGKGA